MRYFFQYFFFHFFSICSWANEMIHLHKISQTPTQKVRFREFNPSIFCNRTKISNIYIYIYAISEGRGHSRNFALRYIRSIYGHFRKHTTIKSAFLTKKHLWFNLYRSGPSFTFQANFFFLYPLKGTIQ